MDETRGRLEHSFGSGEFPQTTALTLTTGRPTRFFVVAVGRVLIAAFWASAQVTMMDANFVWELPAKFERVVVF